MARAAPPRSKTPRRSPGQESLNREYDRLRNTLSKFRDQDSAEKIRRQLITIMVMAERESARWMGNSEGMPENAILSMMTDQDEEGYEMRMPD